MRVVAIDGSLRHPTAGDWEIFLTFVVEGSDGSREVWNTGSGWVRLGRPPTSPGFQGMKLAVEAALSEIEADISRREDGLEPSLPLPVAWTGFDEASRAVLRMLDP